MRPEGDSERTVEPTDLLHHPRVGRRRQSDTTVLTRDDQTEETKLLEPFENRSGDLAGAIDLRGVHVLGEEFPHAVEHHVQPQPAPVMRKTGPVRKSHTVEPAAFPIPSPLTAEERALIRGRWVERAGQRRRRYYRITESGRKVLASQREDWARFIAALVQVAGVKTA